MTKLVSALAYVSLVTNRFPETTAFYNAVPTPLGIKRVLHHVAAYGHIFAKFWMQRPHDGSQAQTADGDHITFLAENNLQVDAFCQSAIVHGSGKRPHYGDECYGCSVRNSDDHKIKMMAWDSRNLSDGHKA